MSKAKHSWLQLVSSGLVSAVIVRRLLHHNSEAGTEATLPPAPKPQGQARSVQPQVRNNKPSGLLGYLKTTFSRFIDDDCTTMAAALAYYTTFSLPPLLL